MEKNVLKLFLESPFPLHGRKTWGKGLIHVMNEHCRVTIVNEVHESTLDCDVLGREPYLALLYSWPLLRGA